MNGFIICIYPPKSYIIINFLQNYNQYGHDLHSFYFIFISIFIFAGLQIENGYEYRILTIYWKKYPKIPLIETESVVRLYKHMIIDNVETTLPIINRILQRSLNKSGMKIFRVKTIRECTKIIFSINYTENTKLRITKTDSSSQNIKRNLSANDSNLTILFTV